MLFTEEEHKKFKEEVITQARKGYVSREMYEEAIAVNRSEVFDEMNKHMNEVMKGMVKIEDMIILLRYIKKVNNNKSILTDVTINTQIGLFEQQIKTQDLENKD